MTPPSPPTPSGPGEDQLGMSWRRSALTGLTPKSARPGAPHPRASRSHRLIEAARPVMDALDPVLRDTGATLLLADRDGRVIRTVRDNARISRMLLRRGVDDGATLTEEAVGSLQNELYLVDLTGEAAPLHLTAGADPAVYGAAKWRTDGLYLLSDRTHDRGALLRVDPATGEVELVMVLDALPGVFPSGTRGGEMLTDPVPTAVLLDEEGNLYVSYLSGAPFIPGTSGVKMLTPDGAVSDYAVGLTMITDLRWGPDGEMYGVQFGMFTEEGPMPGSGALVHILPGADSVPVVEGLTFATSVDFNAAGDAYVTVFGVGPPMSGAVLMFEGVAGGK